MAKRQRPACGWLGPRGERSGALLNGGTYYISHVHTGPGGDYDGRLDLSGVACD
jgi:hypothetical protein